jgi:hypothetical protein
MAKQLSDIAEANISAAGKTVSIKAAPAKTSATAAARKTAAK